MPIVHNPYGEYGKEVRKWEQHHTQFSIDEEQQSTPGNPYVYRAYPRMLYRAVMRQGKHVCLVGPPDPAHFQTDKEFERASLDAERLNRECQRIVKSEDEERVAKNDGWRNSPVEAMAALDEQERAISRAAAEAAYAASTMTDKAKREFDEAQVGTARHVVDVVGGSKKAGRPKKLKPVAPETREQVGA